MATRNALTNGTGKPINEEPRNEWKMTKDMSESCDRVL